MGKFCEVCKKGVMSGNLVSHSNRKTKRSWAETTARWFFVVTENDYIQNKRAHQGGARAATA